MGRDVSSAIRHTAILAGCALVFAPASCSCRASGGPGDRPSVVAAGNVWGSVAPQLGIDAVTSEYKKLDPADASYFDHQRSTFQTTGLAQYHALISEIKTKYAGTPVGASESIFALMAPALGLDLLTPPTFLTAISEGTEPTAADKSTIDHQISSHEIEVYVYNSQNATPDIQRQIDEAKAANIPITTITETLFPAGATFQAWQVAQLQALATALHEATGR